MCTPLTKSLLKQGIFNFNSCFVVFLLFRFFFLRKEERAFRAPVWVNGTPLSYTSTLLEAEGRFAICGCLVPMQLGEKVHVRQLVLQRRQHSWGVQCS